MSSENRPDFLARLIAGIVAQVACRPWFVVTIAIILTLASVSIAYTNLGYHTQRNDLLGADKPCQQRWQKYLDAFGNDDDLVVVAEGADQQQMTAAIEAVAEELRQRPELVDRIFYKFDAGTLLNRGLLYLTPEQLETVAARLDRMAPLLGPAGPVAWRMLSIQSLLANAAHALETRAQGRDLTEADRDLLAQLPAILDSATDTLHNAEAYQNPWTLAGSPTGKGASLPTQAQYFFTPDGSLGILTCRLHLATESFTPAKEANAVVRRILSDVSARFPQITLGLTGIPVLESDEMEQSQNDSTTASWLALAGVAVLYFVVYRGPRYPLLTVGTLVIGTLWSLGWATLTVGHLNILSAAFAVMLIGLGDYGVLWVARYDEVRRKGLSVDDAMRHTALHAGPSIITAATTTGLAFFAVMLADFKAVAELGWIAGSGVLFCAASCILLMPAFLTLAERRNARRPINANEPRHPEPIMSYEAHRHSPAVLTPWLPGLAYRPRMVLAVGIVALLACGVFATRLNYDHNLLKLQPRELESVDWEEKLIARSAGATWDALSIAKTREEALQLKAKYEALPGVGRVVEVASMLPDNQEVKLPLIAAIHARLAGFPPGEDLPPPVDSDPATVANLAGKIAALSEDPTLVHSANTLKVRANSYPDIDRLRAFDRRLSVDLAVELRKLKAVSQPVPITLADVPQELRERYIGAGGEFLVRAFATDSLWDYAALERFTTAAASIDAEATGKAFRTLEGLHQMKLGFERAAIYALVAIVLVLLLDLRRLSELLLGLLPLAIGVGLTLGVMGLCGLSLNPANMIALPLIVGVGVDNGIHVLHDYRSRDHRTAYRLGAATGRGVLVAGLTTVLGFGTLMTARHQGMASLGLVLTLGVTFCMLAALVFLPAVLRLRDLRKLPVQTLPMRRPQPNAAAIPFARAA